MKEITNLLKLTPEQLMYGTLKYLGFEIYDCGDHDENSPHCWPGNAKVTELSRDKAIITISLTGEIHMETSSGSSPVLMSTIIGTHLKQIVGWGGRFNITAGKHGDFLVQTVVDINEHEEVDCTIHGKDLNTTICFAFVQARSKGKLLVPDVLVKE